jgi:peptidoglycan/LPS O-acetylase OafA/YrhL
MDDLHMDPSSAGSNERSSRHLQPNRYRALDGYRFVAASLVVFYHYNLDFGLGLETYLPAVKNLYALVDFFFVLSGFVIATGYIDRVGTLPQYVTFIRRRFARLYPLHAITLLANVGLAVIMALGLAKANHAEFFRLSALPANITLTQAWGFLSAPSFNVVSWSISAEWFLYLVFPALALLARRFNLLGSLALIVMFVITFELLRQAGGLRSWTKADHDFGMLRAVPSFYAGILIAIWVPQLTSRITIPWVAVHLMFLMGLACLTTETLHVFAIALFALTVAAAVLAENSGPTVMGGTRMSRLGDASYGIYMMHVLISIPILVIVRNKIGLGTATAALVALLTYLLVVFLAMIVYRKFEVPMRHWISGDAAIRQGSTKLATERVLSAK